MINRFKSVSDARIGLGYVNLPLAVEFGKEYQAIDLILTSRECLKRMMNSKKFDR